MYPVCLHTHVCSRRKVPSQRWKSLWRSAALLKTEQLGQSSGFRFTLNPQQQQQSCTAYLGEVDIEGILSVVGFRGVGPGDGTPGALKGTCRDSSAYSPQPSKGLHELSSAADKYAASTVTMHIVQTAMQGTYIR
jgi:hypothetical protein